LKQGFLTINHSIQSSYGKTQGAGILKNYARDSRTTVSHYYPGANRDPWWDTKQLMDQIRSAIKIFKAAHTNCQAQFIFDQSSAHASLPPMHSRLLK